MPLRFRPMVAYYGVLPPHEAKHPVRHSDDRTAVERYARENDGHIIEHYREEGRTRRARRPKFAAALRHVERASALLVIARFEPLARDPVFLGVLWSSGVAFVACDNRYANQTTLPLLASLVEKRSRWLALPFGSALGRRKRQRMPVGARRNLNQEARLRGARSTKSLHSTQLDDQTRARLITLRAQGASLRRIAETFNCQGYPTKTGRPWSHTLIKRLLDRHDRPESSQKTHRDLRSGPSATTNPD